MPIRPWSREGQFFFLKPYYTHFFLIYVLYNVRKRYTCIFYQVLIAVCNPIVQILLGYCPCDTHTRNIGTGRYRQLKIEFLILPRHTKNVFLLLSVSLWKDFSSVPVLIEHARKPHNKQHFSHFLLCPKQKKVFQELGS